MDDEASVYEYNANTTYNLHDAGKIITTLPPPQKKARHSTSNLKTMLGRFLPRGQRLNQHCFKIITNTMTLVDYPLFQG